MMLSNEAQDYGDKLKFGSPELEKYSEELEVAVKAVHMACLLCKGVQESLIARSDERVQSKDDDSPVTVAGKSAAALVLFSAILFIYLFGKWDFSSFLFCQVECYCNWVILSWNCLGAVRFRLFFYNPVSSFDRLIVVGFGLFCFLSWTNSLSYLNVHFW